MRIARVRVPLVLIALAVAQGSCSGGDVVDVTDVTPLDPSLSVEVSPGVVVSAHQMDRILGRVAEAVALALGESSTLRDRVLSAMMSSPFPEGKLSFQALFRDAELGLLEAVAAAEGSEASSLLASVDSLLPLEMYIPVASHRATWRGSQDVWVASTLNQHGPIRGFDLSGAPVGLVSGTIPSQPTIVIVPAETDFRRSQAASSLSGSGVASGGSAGGTLFMTKSYQPDDHEPYFPNGDPEIYVHLGRRDHAGSGTVSWYRCSGDNMDAAYSAYDFDQNGTTWTGEVRLAEASDIDGKDFALYVWEDDADPCDGYYNLIPKADTTSWVDVAWPTLLAVLFNGYAYSVCVDGWPPSGSGEWLVCGGTLAFDWGYLGLVGGMINDDFIGLAQVPNCLPVSSGSYRLYLRDESGSATGAYIEVDDDFDFERELCTLEAAPTGPTQVLGCASGLTPPGDYTASVSGGDGLITPSYKWWEDNVLRGTNATYSIYNEDTGQRKIKLEVTRGGQTDADSLYVTIAEPQDPEEECEA